MTKRNRWMASMTRAARAYAETGPSPRALRDARGRDARRSDLLAAAI